MQLHTTNEHKHIKGHVHQHILCELQSWKTLRPHSAFRAHHPRPPPHSAGHRSRTTDQSLGPYVVMSFSLRVKRRGLSRPSAPLCGTFHCFNICMVVRQTIKPNLSPPRGGGGRKRRERVRRCEITDLEEVYY